ncbi:cysteine desulfurase mitochondrial-like [Senna tora]|uniref:Cysteine desulfurase mitochondrial-like n=1 Tax=Senna tora TaxID=362788 RepID=A0A834TW16_9FABA|nr:cysteine desulfurase mitochondrial-like [Senna tora]
MIRGPWTFQNSWLLLQPWNKDSDSLKRSFEKVRLWVQLWGLLPHCKAKVMSRKIGALIDTMIHLVKYKRLAQYYYCGLVGYGEENSKNVEKDGKSGKVSSLELGPWLKLEQLGHKVLQKPTEKKENKVCGKHKRR